MNFSELRVRSRVHPRAMQEMVGKLISDSAYDVLLTGPARVLLPNGKPLCVYLPGALSDLPGTERDTLSSIRARTGNRIRATGARTRIRHKITRGNLVISSTIGYMDAKKNGGLTGNHGCRTTAWTGQHAEEFGSLIPLFRRIARHFKRQVPDRYRVQMRYARRTPPELVISGTPFTTITVNNTFPTGVHKDAGDLDAGFSCLAVFRRGSYRGGRLTFPEYRVAVDMQDGDLLLMDAHQWHGNTPIVDRSEDGERVSLVLYYRTQMVNCPAKRGHMPQEVP